MPLESRVIYSKNWAEYFSPALTKEQRKIFVALNEPTQTILYKDNSSLLRILTEEKIKISKNNKIYKTQTVLAKIVPKNGKLYLIQKNKKHPTILWSELIPLNLEICQNDVLKFYNADWMSPYLGGIITLNMVKPSVLKKKKITNIRQLLKHIYPNLFPEWILKNQKNLTARPLIEINNFLNYAEDKESYTKYISISDKYPYIHFLNDEKLLKNQMVDEGIFVDYQDYQDRRRGVPPAINWLQYYRDIANMCKILNQKFKLSWKTKRITEFHDSLTKELNSFRTMFKSETIFQPALKHQTLPKDKFELIVSGRRLLQEGLDLNHCVASYEERIKLGHCAIYSVEWESKRYTIEMVEWLVNQCRGYKNSNPPQSLLDYINEEKTRYYQELKLLAENSLENLSPEEFKKVNEAKSILDKSAKFTNFPPNLPPDNRPLAIIDQVYFPEAV